ncbi:hypothetical protein J6TS2_45440 [Heyndrickxia sporothermodurans]|nr:hypothetical protein J6TS2_45440 [Heyndrickxia sporothermodurans]
MNRGDKVYYNGEEFEIYYIYESGYCEIKKQHRWNILLVPLTELHILHELKTF